MFSLAVTYPCRNSLVFLVALHCVPPLLCYK